MDIANTAFLNFIVFILTLDFLRGVPNAYQGILRRSCRKSFFSTSSFYHVSGDRAVLHGLFWLIQVIGTPVILYLLLSRSDTHYVYIMPGLVLGIILGTRSAVKDYKRNLSF